MNAIQQYVVFFPLMTPEGLVRLQGSFSAIEKADFDQMLERVEKEILSPLWSCSDPDQLDDKEAFLGHELAEICIGALEKVLRLPPGDLERLSRLEEEVERDSLNRVRARIQDKLGEAVFDSFEWSWRTQMEFVQFFFQEIQQLDPGVLQQVSTELQAARPRQEPALDAVNKMQLYNFGILAAVERETTPFPALIGEFSHRAYVNACIVIDNLRDEGIRVDPYRRDSEEQRRERIARTAGQVLSGLSEEQLTQVEAASLDHSTFFPEDRD